MIPLLSLLPAAACFSPPPLLTGEAPAVDPRPESVRFVAVGDVGKSNPDQRAVASTIDRACAGECDFAVLLGDNLYPRGMAHDTDERMDEVLAPFVELDLPLYLALGNHDYGHGRDHAAAAAQIRWAASHEAVHLAGHAYAFDAGPARLWAVDSTRVFWYGHRPQSEWLSAELDAYPDRVRIVFGHHTMRSNGRHGNAGEYEGWRRVPWMSGRPLARLFDQAVCGRADLYLSGHDHNLQLLDHCGTTLIVSGSGASTQPLEDRGNSPQFAAAEAGFALVEVHDALNVEFWTVRGGRVHRATRPLPAR